ncbi:MAG: glycosyltransferase family 2 protein [Methanomassiliicoccales archaeon]|nr:MAG: glycosyltransferase family 2 protein [Methanomassiliicoccales archaeon]
MKIAIILPTYNEKENIEILIPKLEVEIKNIKKHDFEILVVDDNSPDNTASAVNQLQKQYKNLHLVSGEKKGLGVAYLRGASYAIDKLKADVLIMMDADLSHPPELIAELMKGIDEGYDLVIGSRYVKGGATPDWNLRRRVISKVGNSFARIIAGMYKIHDCTSGYRAIRTSVYKKVNTKNLSTKGYAFISTLLYELFSVGARAKEVPLVFYDRKYGDTKLKSKDMMEFFFNSFRLRFKSSKRMIKFAAVGGSGIFVNLGIFTLAKNVLYPLYGRTNMTLLASSLTGDEISIIYNFLLNHYWTFRGVTSKEHILKKLAKFHIVALTSVVINNAVLFFLHIGFGLTDVVAKFIGIIIAFIWNYLLNVKWTWREKIQ